MREFASFLQHAIKIPNHAEKIDETGRQAGDVRSLECRSLENLHGV
jgi:hypothetical protein